MHVSIGCSFTVQRKVLWCKGQQPVGKRKSSHASVGEQHLAVRVRRSLAKWRSSATKMLRSTLLFSSRRMAGKRNHMAKEKNTLGFWIILKNKKKGETENRYCSINEKKKQGKLWYIYLFLVLLLLCRFSICASSVEVLFLFSCSSSSSFFFPFLLIVNDTSQSINFLDGASSLSHSTRCVDVPILSLSLARWLAWGKKQDIQAWKEAYPSRCSDFFALSFRSFSICQTRVLMHASTIG